MSANEYRIEAVPLMKHGFSDKENTDWADQELDDLVQSPLEDILEHMQQHPKNISYKQYIRGIIFSSLICLIFGAVISHLLFTFFCTPSVSSHHEEYIVNKIIKYIHKENIKEILHNLTLKEHIAGTPEEKATADYIHKLWISQGLDEVKLAPYDVLLSYPRKEKPNKISIVSGDSELFTINKWEKTFQDTDNHYPPFSAYSPPTEDAILGKLVYVNYGQHEDFQKLKELNVDIKGCIAIIRYGKIFRANKVKLAAEYGAKAVILYSDPADTAPNGPEDVYPKSVFLPADGIQRGTLSTFNGDPTTPFYPSIKSAYRSSGESALPKIPVHPIGYGDAEILMRDMDGEVAPSNWKGGLNIPYKLGPGYNDSKRLVKMEIHNYNIIKTVYNVIGIIHGKIEPDRYVLVGNHRDAWTFGAVDPSSGTAAMLEISRVFGEFLKNGWRPRRTVIFCSWAAEEYGLIGSTEWVEENQKQLNARAVAYLNVDIAVAGNYSLRARASPILYKALWKAAKMVPNPNPSEVLLGKSTVFDTWKKEESSLPKILNLGSGSDYTAFFHGFGIPSIDIRYNCDTKGPIECYPLYHTAYETFYLQDKLIDRHFHFHKAVAQMWGVITVSLAESIVLPFGIKEYDEVLNNSFTSIKSSYNYVFARRDISLDYFEASVRNFSKAVSEFEEMKKKVDLKNPFAVRKLNDQMMLVERAFIDFNGMPTDKSYRHIVFAPSIFDGYKSNNFACLVDLLEQLQDTQNEDKLWEAIKKHLSVIVFHINIASSVLCDSFDKS